MNFASVPSGSSIYLDANVFIYDFGPDPQYGLACRSLLKRIEDGDLEGFTSAQDMSNVAHRLMTLEACQTFGWPYAGIAHRLRTHPAELARLSRFQGALRGILRIGVHVLPVDRQHVVSAADLSLQHGLLSGDALIIAVMQRQGVTNLASADSDFDRVPGITRYSPS